MITPPPSRLMDASRRPWRIVGHVALLAATGALLTSIAGAAVIVSPILLPLLLWATWHTHGVLRWVYAILATVLMVEITWMIYNTLAGTGHTPANTP